MPKLVAKSNMAKHRKNKDKILQKLQEKRVYDQFRHLELTEREAQGVEVEKMEKTAWTPLPKTKDAEDLIYGVSLDPNLFAHFLAELKARRKAKHGRGPSMISPRELYRVAIFVLHPDKLRGQISKFGDETDKLMNYWSTTAKAFTVFGNGLTEDTEMRPQIELDAMTDVEYRLPPLVVDNLI
ncbi:hypothetical protein PHYSODRAFT_332528 [Phytophthora sojae]|uniref:Uncharacterized protein n=1 Tax=Phytophthora sojae (strain P6497) TaxID=1094619 RepID=G4ZIY0_PHYSP|nr:hypothetical protein PHYSODRAFT_332528 [Phytophthora sojae]EGZ18785.1 hypothetical protein PHYSODRAFT_332528 [Phytophthora sojae]|eukprot:XP_009527843.1 hypothetical protein PHYSODRAFT_332528 [Phytophthora sojae]